MSRDGNIPARRLHHASVKFSDRLVMGASVFPLFDREGTVWKLMLCWRGSDRIVLLDYAPGRIRPNWWGFAVDAALAEEHSLTGERVRGLGRLWHFDPWWVLRHHRFNGHPATDPLKRTNLAGQTLATIHRLEFEPDLSRVATWSTDRIGPMKPFDPEFLPTRQRVTEPAPHRRPTGWRLRPIWQRS